VVVLAIANILTNRVLPDWAYLPFNVGLTVLLVRLGRREVTDREMGFTAWSSGFRWGGVVALATLAIYLAAVVLPPFHDLFEDRRVDASVWSVLYHTLVRIPFGTVLLEEVAFRGVLPALLAVPWGRFRAYLLASVLFGFWHVLPSWRLGDVNPVADRMLGDGAAGQVAGIAFAVAGTFLAGMWLSFLRARSGSILAPMMAHVATNSFGYAIAWVVTS
jgi:membrane protease YdiL (CAAX protease family)